MEKNIKRDAGEGIENLVCRVPNGYFIALHAKPIWGEDGNFWSGGYDAEVRPIVEGASYGGFGMTVEDAVKNALFEFYEHHYSKEKP
jgi:hypothetical protein|tara:strand:+ start:77 stop:337 length:261 start_codon:yes stop_codon:yes gene_type:complete